MADGELTQDEADSLIAVEKHCRDNTLFTYPPDPGDAMKVPLVTADDREHFILSMRRGQIALTKATYLMRARVSIPLVRLDVDGPPHSNPDGTLVLTPHLHLYREGFRDRWAFPVPDRFSDVNDFWQALQDFMGYCNVATPPNIQQRIT